MVLEIPILFLQHMYRIWQPREHILQIGVKVGWRCLVTSVYSKGISSDLSILRNRKSYNIYYSIDFSGFSDFSHRAGNDSWKIHRVLFEISMLFKAKANIWYVSTFLKPHYYLLWAEDFIGQYDQIRKSVSPNFNYFYINRRLMFLKHFLPLMNVGLRRIDGLGRPRLLPLNIVSCSDVFNNRQGNSFSRSKMCWNWKKVN